MAEPKMAARSSWSGAISFGLVNVPVKLYGATTARDLRFNQLHADCGERVRQGSLGGGSSRHCDAGHEVLSGEVVKGFEVDKGVYAIVTDEDKEAVESKAGKALEIVQFVPPGSISPTMYEKAFYVQPDDTGYKAFSLLRQAMKAENVWAVARLVMRDKEHFAVLRFEGDRLMVNTMFWPDEVKIPPVDTPQVEVAEQELSMARLLVQNLSNEELDLSQFSDRYREELLARLQAKVEGRELTDAPREAPAAAKDLMDALKAAVAATSKEKVA